MSDGATIETARLVLRRARMEDVAALHRVFSDPRAMRYWDSPPYRQTALTRRLVEAMVSARPGESDDFVVTLEGEVIGKAGCWRLGEVGVILHPDHWGRGLGREALSAAIPHAFDSLPMDRIEADVDPRNKASLRLLTALGFRETGRARRTIQVAGAWCDSVYLELLRDADAPGRQA